MDLRDIQDNLPSLMTLSGSSESQLAALRKVVTDLDNHLLNENDDNDVRKCRIIIARAFERLTYIFDNADIPKLSSLREDEAWLGITDIASKLNELRHRTNGGITKEQTLFHEAIAQHFLWDETDLDKYGLSKLSALSSGFTEAEQRDYAHTILSTLLPQNHTDLEHDDLISLIDKLAQTRPFKESSQLYFNLASEVFTLAAQKLEADTLHLSTAPLSPNEKTHFNTRTTQLLKSILPLTEAQNQKRIQEADGFHESLNHYLDAQIHNLTNRQGSDIIKYVIAATPKNFRTNFRSLIEPYVQKSAGKHLSVKRFEDFMGACKHYQCAPNEEQLEILYSGMEKRVSDKRQTLGELGKFVLICAENDVVPHKDAMDSLFTCMNILLDNHHLQPVSFTNCCDLLSACAKVNVTPPDETMQRLFSHLDDFTIRGNGVRAAVDLCFSCAQISARDEAFQSKHSKGIEKLLNQCNSEAASLNAYTQHKLLNTLDFFKESPQFTLERIGQNQTHSSSKVQRRLYEKCQDHARKRQEESSLGIELNIEQEIYFPQTRSPVDMKITVSNSSLGMKNVDPTVFWVQFDGPSHYVTKSTGTLIPNGTTVLQTALAKRDLPPNENYIRIRYGNFIDRGPIVLAADIIDNCIKTHMMRSFKARDAGQGFAAALGQ